MEPETSRLTEHRKRIDEIDQKILRLLKLRVEAAKEIGRTKKELGKGVYDPQREQEVLDIISSTTELDKGFVQGIFKQIMEYCKNEQNTNNRTRSKGDVH